MTSTDTKIVREKLSVSPLSIHSANEAIAITKTVGTKYPDTISAIWAIGALDCCASSMSFIIWARAVLSPTLVALNLMRPFLFMVAANTLSPTFLSTGMLSPVSMDSSTDVKPSVISPSTGIFAPGFTSTMSFSSTSSIDISISFPFLITVAVFGASPISFLIASEVLPFDTASMDLPRSMSVIMTPAVSK